jgi:hypothetical protein
LVVDPGPRGAARVPTIELIKNRALEPADGDAPTAVGDPCHPRTLDRLVNVCPAFPDQALAKSLRNLSMNGRPAARALSESEVSEDDQYDDDDPDDREHTHLLSPPCFIDSGGPRTPIS